jgi:predicted transcriptional regulator
MSTATIRIDDALRARIARVAGATDQSPHSFMVQALTEKVVEAEWKLAMQEEASQRDAALKAGEPGVEWHEMKSWLAQRLADQAGQAQPPNCRKRRS